MIEIDIEEGLRVKIDQENHISSIISSPKATGNVTIPKYAEFECDQYKIISIEQFAFKGNDIKSIIFPADSFVETFETQCFYDSHLEKLQIPSQLKRIKEGCFDSVKYLCDIDVSKQNKLFSYIDKKYLVGKSDENEQSRFDILYYVRSDIKKAVIPSEIKEIRRSAIQNKNKLSTLQFSESPFLKKIGQNVFNGNPITKLVLPDTIEEIDPSNFDGLCVLNKIKISSKNENFQYFDKKFLLSKSQNGSFDKLIFVNRDVDRVQVPSFVKEIGPYAFRNCKKLKVVQFDENSVLNHICHHAFSYVDGLGCITIPASVTQVDYSAFYGNEGLHSITFLGKVLNVDLTCVFQCRKLVNIYFSNALNLNIDAPEDLFGFPKSCSIKVKRIAKLTGTAVENCKNQIHYT